MVNQSDYLKSIILKRSKVETSEKYVWLWPFVCILRSLFGESLLTREEASLAIVKKYHIIMAANNNKPQTVEHFWRFLNAEKCYGNETFGVCFFFQPLSKQVLKKLRPDMGLGDFKQWRRLI